MHLFGKTVLVTGSSRGIGRAIAEAFGKAGCNVVLNASKSKEELNETYQYFQKEDIICHPILADVSQYEDCKRLFDEIKQKFGHVDILVNNAGISWLGLFSDMQPEAWQRIMSVNLYSVFNCTHLAVPSMVQAHDGIILNISSMWGEKGASCEAVYSASKGGVNAFTKSMAKEVGPSGVRVNAISCGVIDTQMNGWLNEAEKEQLTDEISLMRFGKTEEVANLALFLAGDNASFITGQIITIDGCMV